MRPDLGYRRLHQGEEHWIRPEWLSQPDRDVEVVLSATGLTTGDVAYQAYRRDRHHGTWLAIGREQDSLNAAAAQLSITGVWCAWLPHSQEAWLDRLTGGAS